MKTRITLLTAIFLLAWLNPGMAASNDEDFDLDAAFASAFAADWVDSWNSHDLERVLAHYTDDFSMSSLRISFLGFDESGTLHGKDAVREYWAPSLGENSQVDFQLITTLLAPDSITIYYRATRGGRLAAEVFIFDENGKVKQSIAHYDVESL